MRTRQSMAAVATAFLLAVSTDDSHASVAVPSLRQYAHQAWRTEDGFAGGHRIGAIVQSPDGYLLLGTSNGIFRFDGIRTVLWQPLSDHLTSPVLDLLYGRDGTLWIATTTGLMGWNGGTLTRNPELQTRRVSELVEDREGAIWASSWGPTFDILCAVRDGSTHCHGQDGSLGRLSGLIVDSRGSIWAGAEDGLWQGRNGSLQFHRTPFDYLDTVVPLAEEGADALLVGVGGGLGRFRGGRVEPLTLPRTLPDFRAQRAIRDRRGRTWIGLFDTGLLHLNNNRFDWFTESSGLSRNYVVDLLEDREGNIWTVTNAGLDRFRERAAATMMARQGLPDHSVNAILAANDGSIWIATSSRFVQWRGDDPVQILDARVDTTQLVQDPHGRIWASTSDSRVGYLDNGVFKPLQSFPRGDILAITADAVGDVWLVVRTENAIGPASQATIELVRMRGERIVERTDWRRLGSRDRPPKILVPDPAEGIWAGLFRHGIVHIAGGRTRIEHAASAGEGVGHVWNLRFDGAGTLWAATTAGLVRVKNGRATTLPVRSQFPCETDAVSWTLEDHLGAMWMYLSCGIVRVDRAELEALFDGMNQSGASDRRLRAVRFSRADGIPDGRDGIFSPRGAIARDGRLWVSSGDGVSVLDPRNIPFNALPPPVHIEQLMVDNTPRQPAKGTSLPALVRDIQIDYTALSLTLPEHVQFRYQLQGHDPAWREVGTRRQAFYSNLGPGHYRFLVSASNSDGVWNEEGAALDFTIAPAYYQTHWFRVSLAVTFIALAVGAYRLRTRQLARQLDIRFEERLSERTRLARDLHDTLLQTIQGSKMVADSALARPDDAARQRTALEQVAQWLDRAAREGRAALRSLRTPDAQADLASALQRAAHTHAGPLSLAVAFSVVGAPRPINMTVRDDVFHIGEEAIRNACTHASAASLVVELQFGRELILRVRDDGKGIDHDAATRGRDDHFGVLGMRERARQVKGTLTIQGSASGTEVTLVVPGDLAFTA